MVAHTLIVDKAVYFFKGAGLRWAFFSIFIFKKTKFQKYMPNREIFKNGCLSLMGDRVPVAHPVGDRT